MAKMETDKLRIEESLDQAPIFVNLQQINICPTTQNMSARNKGWRLQIHPQPKPAKSKNLETPCYGPCVPLHLVKRTKSLASHLDGKGRTKGFLDNVNYSCYHRVICPQQAILHCSIWV